METTLQARFQDVDDFVAHMKLWGWQGSVAQSAPGRLDVEVSISSGDGFVATRTRHSLANIREIATPEGARTFGVVIPEGGSNHWCGRSFDRIVLQRMPTSPYDAANAAGHLGYQVAFSDELIAESLEQLELADALDRSSCLIELEGADGAEMAGMLDALCAPRPELQIRRAAEDVLSVLLRSFSESTRRRPTMPPGRRRAYQMALEYIEAHLADALTLADLCRAVGTSRRSLTEAFRENIGISPMAYLKRARLNRVRSALSTADDPSVRIVDIANDAGFWHMGQLARDYRALFGELPSETRAHRGRTTVALARSPTRRA